MLIAKLLFAAMPAVYVPHPEPVFAMSGVLQSGDAPAREVRLEVACRQASGGELTFELTVPEAERYPDYEYAEFAGPHLPAHDKPLSRLTWSGAEGSVSINQFAFGGFIAAIDAVPPLWNARGFFFSIDALPSNAPAPAKLLRAIAGSGHLEWVQSGLHDPARMLSATFAFEEADARRLAAVVAPCLSAAASRH